MARELCHSPNRSRDWLPLFGERDTEVSKVSLFPTSDQSALVLNIADAQVLILAIRVISSDTPTRVSISFLPCFTRLFMRLSPSN
jgi:hypothetical protein